MSNYTTNPLENKAFTQQNDAVRSAATLRLFASNPLCVGGTTDTSFAPEPTELTTRNASEFFTYDHTPIKFTDGHAIGDNFEYATAIPLDIDNSHSDNPAADWVHPEDMEKLLQELGLNYWMSASRNHWRSKDGEAIRPRFHVYLPLASPLHDADKFVLFCLWCIKMVNSDPKVRLKSQKLFGYGDNSKQFFRHWNEGRCIDEVVSDSDLVTVATPPTSEPGPAVLKTLPSLPPAVADYFKAGVFPSGKRDFDGRKQHLTETGQTFTVAQILCGLTDGNRPDDPEHHQPCPILDCKSDDDGFYSRLDTFHCRKCGFNGDIIALVSRVHAVTPSVAFDMITVVAGDSSISEPKQKPAPHIPTMPQNAGNSGNNINVQNDVFQSEYPYHDERGFWQYKNVRKDFTDANGEPHKEFYPVSRDADGNIVIKEPETLYPYRLPEVLHSKMVFIVEGEKCADFLSVTLAVARCKGIAVTTSQGGAQRGNLWQVFLQRYPAIADKIIRILPDNDAAGMNYARTISAAILAVNPDADVKIVGLPDLPNDLIPARDPDNPMGGSCTGAPSVIVNNTDSDRVYADVEFYQEADFFEEIIKPYYRALDPEQRWMLPPSNFYEFSNSPFASLPNEFSGNTRIRNLYDALKLRQTSANQYQRDFGRRLSNVENPDEIRRYVAQKDKDNRPIMDWIPVKMVMIYCPFMVCDTVFVSKAHR